jgi:hypothetical protein
MARSTLAAFRGIAAGTIKGVTQFRSFVTTLAIRGTRHLNVTLQTVEVVGSLKARFVYMIDIFFGFLLAEVARRKRLK